MKKTFRLLIILFFLLVIPTLFFELEDTQPETFTVQEIIHLTKASSQHYLDLLHDVMVLLFSILFLGAVSLIGMFVFWSPARYLFIFVIIVSHLVTPPFSENYNSLGKTLEVLFIIFEIAIILMCFTRPIKNYFIEKEQKV